MLKKILLLLSVIIIMPNITFAEDPYEILDKYIEVTKGKLRKDSIQTLKFTAVENATNPQTGQTGTASIKFWFKRDSMFRIEQEANGIKSKFGYNGQVLWGSSSSNPEKYEEIPNTYKTQVIGQMMNENIVGGSLADYNKDSVKLEFVGKVTMDEKELFKIKQNVEDGKFFYLYFDAITGLMYQIEIETPQGSYFRKTKSVTKSAGFFFPLKVEEWLGDKKVSDKTYQAITVNPKVDDRFFAMPENK